MAASRKDVDRWIQTAKDDKCKYIISVCDTWDWDDYPVYCKDLKELQKSIPRYDNTNMQRINEIIEIDGDTVTENLGTYRFDKNRI